MSLISQIKILLTRLADGIEGLSISTKSFRNTLENLRHIEGVRLYTKTIARHFIELNEDLKHIDKALEEYNIELIDKSIKNLENKISYMVSNIVKSNLRTSALMSLAIFFLTIASIITSYSSIYHFLEDYPIALMILSMGIGSIVLVGFFLRLLSVTLLMPSIPLISLVQLIIILAKGYIDNYILMLILFVGCSLFIAIDINLYAIKTYKNTILAFLNFSKMIESILSKINRIEVKKLSIKIQDLIKDYEKVYRNEAYELIKYIEELSSMRS